MGIAKAYTLKRAAYSSGHLALVFTVTQEGHPLAGKKFEFEIFTAVTVKTDAKSTALMGNGSWPVTHTPTMAEGPTFEIADVPAEERFRFVEFIGDGNGPAATSGSLTITAKLPGLDPDVCEIQNAKLESLADLTFKRDGTIDTVSGVYTNMLMNGIDPLVQRF